MYKNAISNLRLVSNLKRFTIHATFKSLLSTQSLFCKLIPIIDHCVSTRAFSLCSRSKNVDKCININTSIFYSLD